jgi:2-oxo-4-hydroxy-4-carboxy-5-ureidoimidazoline decarboxylase
VSAAAKLDAAGDDDALALLRRCCGAERWARAMAARRPFGDDAALLAAADEVWAAMDRADVLEAFTHHPRIGADMDALRAKFRATADWSAAEQAGAAGASDEVLRALGDGNLRYEAKFGHIFIVCATGKTAAEMLALLEARMPNDPEVELRVAAGEQAKITKIRLEKLA